MPSLAPLGLAVLAGLSTGIGSLLGVKVTLGKRGLSFVLGFSAGVMMAVSFLELLFSSIQALGFGKANLLFFSGMAIMLLLDKVVPHEYLKEVSLEKRRVMEAGMMTSAGITLHNFPEGLAVVAGGMASLELGVLLAVAIALHNIPEGLAISAPIFYATKSRKKALKYSFLSGGAEIAGALAGWVALSSVVNGNVLDMMLAMVGGIMVFISLDELLPAAYDCMKKCEPKTGHLIIYGVMLGMAVMASSIWMMG